MSNPAALLDALVAVKAEIEKLRLEEDKLRTALIETGEREIHSEMHRAVISNKVGAARTDWKAVAAHFNPSRQLVTAHTTTGNPTTQVNIYAHRGA